MNNEFIKWSNELYSVGIEKIDKEHKKLTDIINKLFKSFSEGKAEEIIPEILEELTEYTQYHFKTEEELFDKYEYPEKDVHIAKHHEFIDQVVTYKQKIEDGQKNIHYELMNFLKTWLIKHIMHDDKSYSKFFKESDILI